MTLRCGAFYLFSSKRLSKRGGGGVGAGVYIDWCITLE